MPRTHLQSGTIHPRCYAENDSYDDLVLVPDVTHAHTHDTYNTQRDPETGEPKQKHRWPRRLKKSVKSMPQKREVLIEAWRRKKSKQRAQRAAKRLQRNPKPPPADDVSTSSAISDPEPPTPEARLHTLPMWSAAPPPEATLQEHLTHVQHMQEVLNSREQQTQRVTASTDLASMHWARQCLVVDFDTPHNAEHPCAQDIATITRTQHLRRL